MDQMTTLDAGFLKAEDADRHVSLAVGGLAIIEGPAPEQEALVTTFARRIRGCPRFAQRLRRRPFDLGAPEWVDDPDFDIERHVRRVALPHPGDDRELFRLIADVMAWRLERNRPLWEIWVIEGLTDNRWAMLTKVHHCMAEELGAGHVLAGLCDDVVSDSFSRRAAQQRSPTGWWQAVSTNPSSALIGLWNARAAITTTLARAADIAGALLWPAPSPLNGPIGDLRRYSGARVPLTDIEEICQTFDVSVTDVALAAITESYRNVLLKRGERPSPDSLRTLVPMPLGAPDALAEAGHGASPMLPYLPVDQENPVERLRTVRSRLGGSKPGRQRHAGHFLMSIASRLPFPVMALAVGLLMRLPQRAVVTAATTVPGPPRPMWVMGKRVLSLFPIPPILMQLRTGVAMLRYGDDLYFGILADFGVADVGDLARGIELAVTRLVAISKRRRIPPSRGVLSLVV